MRLAPAGVMPHHSTLAGARAVLMDIDGTLIDSGDAQARC